MNVQNDLLKLFSKKFPHVEFKLDRNPQNGQAYYSELRFQIHAGDASGSDLLLVDGGFTEWTRKVLSNSKERFLISGLGSERLIFGF